MFKNYTLCIFLLVIFVIIFSVVNGESLAMTYQEAPMLSKLVEEGEILPVEERLPEKPLVVSDGTLIPQKSLDFQVGRYGGVLQTAHFTPNFHEALNMASCEPLLRGPGIDASKIYPNLVEEYQVSEDNTTFTFKLREGLRWSDGVPVTTEDVLFAYEDVMLNKKLTPYFPVKYRSGRQSDGEPMQVEAIDDYTFVIEFQRPYGVFLTQIAIESWGNYLDLLKPKHYLKQFHADYTSLEEMKPLLEKHELGNEWWNLFNLKDIAHFGHTAADSIGTPVLTPWMRVEGPEEVIVMERNPYYFKVDEEGNQLPYIDGFESHEVTDVEMLQMKIITGEVKYLSPGSGTSFLSIPLYREHQESGGYIAHILDMDFTAAVLYPNYTFEDDTWRNISQDIRFRKALNYALDREDIMDTIYYGYGSLPETVPGHYDPQRARELLDEMGMNERGEDGYRLAPNGEEFEFFIEIASAYSEDVLDVTELMVDHFQEIGINTSMRLRSPELIGVKRDANELMATVEWSHGREWREGIFHGDYLPGLFWGQAWGAWYDSGGKEGEEPPAWIKELFNIAERRMSESPLSEEGMQATEDLYTWFAENIPVIIPVEKLPAVMILHEDLGNVPHDIRPGELVLATEQLFFKE